MKYYIFFVISITNYLSVSSQNLQQVIQSFETEVISKADSIAQALISCSQCSSSYKSCVSNLPSVQCFGNFKNKNCESCYDTSGMMLSNESTVHLGNVFFPVVDENESVVRQLVCSSKTAEQYLKGNSNSNIIPKWQYIGTYNGIFRSFPGVESCSAYDPRIRKWYVGAATGAKNVMIILDISGSMIQGSRLSIAKKAAIKVIDTLNNFDWVGVVLFSTTAKSYQSKLIRATAENISALKDYINDITATGSTNFEAAFKLAFSIMDSSKGDELGNACKTVILFMTDGQITEGELDEGKIVSLVSSLNSSHKAIVFTYSLGTDADQTTTKAIACSENGIYEFIEFELDLEKAMSSYYLLLSAGLERRKYVVWSEPYEDFYGLGTVTTASVPIYDTRSNPPFLIGVVGFDVNISDLEKYDNYNDILNAFVTRSQTCSKFELTPCQMNFIRKEKCSNINDNCTPVKTVMDSCGTTFNNVFREDMIVGTSSNSAYEPKCCGNDNCSNIGPIVGGVVGGVVGLAIIITIIVCCIKKKNSSVDDNDQNKGVRVAAQSSEVPRAPGA